MPPDSTTTPTARPPAGPPRRRIRRATVVDSQRISPNVQRVTVQSPELDGFDPTRDGHGGHIKLFLPNADERAAHPLAAPSPCSTKSTASWLVEGSKVRGV